MKCSAHEGSVQGRSYENITDTGLQTSEHTRKHCYAQRRETSSSGPELNEVQRNNSRLSSVYEGECGARNDSLAAFLDLTPAENIKNQTYFSIYTVNFFHCCKGIKINRLFGSL